MRFWYLSHMHCLLLGSCVGNQHPRSIRLAFAVRIHKIWIKKSDKTNKTLASFDAHAKLNDAVLFNGRKLFYFKT